MCCFALIVWGGRLFGRWLGLSEVSVWVAYDCFVRGERQPTVSYSLCLVTGCPLPFCNAAKEP